MKTTCLVALVVFAALSSPAAAPAQNTAPPRAAPPTERNGLNEQLHRLDVSIDRRLAHGHISKHDAAAAHREAFDIQSDLADARLRNGGQVPSDEHFRLQDRVNKLQEQIDSERIGGTPH
ncbi:MAG TPA: hypothetical protein VH353_08380 [Caulobacteraceae bacterium]|jgi:hypothetical protein|nr:hypothetical protein [Caulobacteraceae bacterium]